MSDDPLLTPNIQFTPEFKRSLRQLAKKYRRIQEDVQPLLDALQQGLTPGDQIPNVQYEVFKVRLRNSDSNKGKSGGYRIIYQRTTEAVVLITLYAKSEQTDVAPAEVRAIIADYDHLQAQTSAAKTPTLPPEAADDI